MEGASMTRPILVMALFIASGAAAAQTASDGRRPSRAQRDSAARAERARADSAARARADSIARLQTRADTAKLRRVLDSLAGAHRGFVGYRVKNLETGESLERNGDSTFATASLIKVPILVTLFDQVEQKRIGLGEKIVVLKGDKVGGSGILQFMHDGLEITVADAAWLMIALSDNTATNLLLDEVPMRRVWQKMEALGLPHTKVHSKSFLRITSVAPDSSAKYGLGVTTPNEMVRLYELLATGKAVSAAADSAMLQIMRGTQYDYLLQRFAAGVPSAFKTGQNSDQRTECTLWWMPARLIACVLTNRNEDQRWVHDQASELLLAEMGRAIVQAWRPPPAAPVPSAASPR